MPEPNVCIVVAIFIFTLKTHAPHTGALGAGGRGSDGAGWRIITAAKPKERGSATGAIVHAAQPQLLLQKDFALKVEIEAIIVHAAQPQLVLRPGLWLMN